MNLVLKDMLECNVLREWLYFK